MSSRFVWRLALLWQPICAGRTLTICRYWIAVFAHRECVRSRDGDQQRDPRRGRQTAMADKTVPPPVPKNLAKWRDEGSVKEIHGHQILVHASGPVSDDGHGVLYVHGYPGSSWSPEIPAMSQVEDITWLPHPTTRRSGREGSLPPRTRRNPCRNKGFNVYLSGGAEGIRTPDPLTARRTQGVSLTCGYAPKHPLTRGFVAQQLSLFRAVFCSLADSPRTLVGSA